MQKKGVGAEDLYPLFNKQTLNIMLPRPTPAYPTQAHAPEEQQKKTPENPPPNQSQPQT